MQRAQLDRMLMNFVKTQILCFNRRVYGRTCKMKKMKYDFEKTYRDQHAISCKGATLTPNLAGASNQSRLHCMFLFKGTDVITMQIEHLLREAKPLFPDGCCIYRVPYDIHRLNNDAYTPKVVSIGPFHRGNKRLLKMEGYKQRFCRKFLQRSKASLTQLVERVQILEPRVRSSYSENIALSKEEFVKVILVDCGFIFELFLRDRFPELTENNPIYLKEWLRSDIRLDLLLLENQLPFFVLEELYNLAFDSHSPPYPSFLDLSVKFLFDGEQNSPCTGNVTHFTNLYRAFQLPPSGRRPSRVSGVLAHLPSATQLNEAGIKFMVNDASNCQQLDLEISGDILKIPQIKVNKSAEILLRNIVALEQCHYYEESYITDYIAFLDFLINTDKDVEILVKKEIIVNWLGDTHAVAKLFNGLWRNIAHANFNAKYLSISEELNAYCKHPLHRRIATLRRDYCNTPWKTVASIAGIILLVLDVIQTVCAVSQLK